MPKDKAIINKSKRFDLRTQASRHAGFVHLSTRSTEQSSQLRRLQARPFRSGWIRGAENDAACCHALQPGNSPTRLAHSSPRIRPPWEKGQMGTRGWVLGRVCFCVWLCAQPARNLLVIAAGANPSWP